MLTRAPALALLTLSLAACDSKPSSPPPATTPAALNTAATKKVTTRVPDGQTYKGLLRSNTLPFVIQLGKHGDLEIETTSNVILNGESALALGAKGVALPKTLQVQQFATTPDTVLIQVDVGKGSDTSLVSVNSADGAAPLLIDTLKAKYFPVGYVYEDETKLLIRFTPGDPIQDFSKLPALSRSRPAQKLTLLYRVTATREVKYFALSNSAMVEYDPPFPVSGGR